MKVAFIVSEDDSLGVGYLSSYLKKLGHETFLIFDPRLFERFFGQNMLLSRLFNIEEKNVEEIEKINPDIIAFSALTSNYQWSLRMASKIKAKMGTPIIFGGFHATMVPDVVIKNDCVDMVCIGEGEEPFAELLKNWNNKKKYKTRNIWFKKGKKIIKNEIRSLIQNLDSLPFPDKEIFYEKLPKSYRRNTFIITSRGCPFACSYCGNNALRKIYSGKGCYVRQRSVDNVIEELLQIKRKYKPKHIFFVDDIFGVNIRWLREFIGKYKSKVGLQFTCNGHFKLFTEESIALLKSGGCKLITFGLQSGSERIRNTILNRHEKNSDVERISKICHRLKINFSMDYIINIPKEKEEDILESLKFYNKIKPNVVNIYGLLYLPKTEIIETAKKAGILNKNIDDVINNGQFGLYINAILTTRGENLQENYRKYALLFSILPLIPQKLMEKVINSQRLRNIFVCMPILFISLIKIIVLARAGTGFLPLTLFRNGLSFAYKAIRIK